MTTYKVTTINNELKEKEVTRFSYEITNNVLPRMVKECDKFFGKGLWKKVQDYDTSLSNVLGWYATSIDENNGETLSIEPVF